MKRFLTALTASLLIFSLFACSVSDETTRNPDDTAKTTDGTETPSSDVTSPESKVDEIGNGKHVMALLMNHERTAAYSGAYGTWGNSGKDLKHQPDKVDENGLRDIATIYYPSIGLYDVNDPDYQEYMMQLCKMSYIDTLNYYISTASEIKDGAWWGDNFTNNIAPMLRKYGLSSTARLEKPINSMKDESDTETIKKAFTDIVNKLDDTILKIDGRPVLAQFTVEGLEAATIDDWKVEYLAEYGAVPFFMLRESTSYFKSNWFEAVDGFFGWVELDDNALDLQYTSDLGDYRKHATAEQSMKNHDLYLERIKALKSEGKINFYSEALTPHFDDIEVWGWGHSPRKIEGGDNCELYVYKWESAIKNDAQMVNIPTWDDWGESSTIEPTLEYGTDYLEVTRRYAAKYKGIEANTASLELPGWIYKIRKTTEDERILAEMDTASQLIADSRYNEAEALVRPYVTSLGIPATSKEFFDYPTTPTTPLIAEDNGEGKTPTVNGDTEIWTPTADTYVAITSQTNIDAGKETKFRVKNAYATRLSRSAFIQFDTSSTTLEGVSKATLRLFCTYSTSDANEIAGRDINLYSTVADWREESFSWKTKPMVLEKVADVDTTNLKTNQWIEIDVTEYLKYNLGRRISFSLVNDGADTEENHLDFASKEAGKNLPQLILIKGDKVEPKPEIDIKETLLTAIADTYVANDGKQDGGSESLVRLKKMDSAKRTRNTYFKFDTASVKDTQIFKATLKLFCKVSSENKDYVKTRYITVNATSTDWQENSFTWSTQPNTTEKIVAYLDTSSYAANKWVEIDITEYIKAHAGEVISISIRNEGTDHEEAHIDFASRETAGYEPSIIIIGG